MTRDDADGEVLSRGSVDRSELKIGLHGASEKSEGCVGSIGRSSRANV